MNPLISIQILNWNRAEETQRAIQSALQQSYHPLEIVVVDNGSTDDSVAITRANYPEVKIIELNKNYGCPGGRNRGIPYCHGDYIFYLDNDGVLHRYAVENAYKTMTRLDNVGIVTGIVYDFDNPDEIDTEFQIDSNNIYGVKEFQGGICLHDKKIYEKVGYYPDHFMYGGEESFLSLKLHDTNFRIVKDESAILWHKRSIIARNRNKELINAFYNKLYIAFVLFPLFKATTFFIYFIVCYPYYAYKEGVFNYYVKTFPGRIIRTIYKGIRDRDPVSKKAYINFSRNRRGII